MQQTRRSRVLSALAAAAFCAASAAALALPLTAAAASDSAEVAAAVDTAASTRHDEPAGGCRGVEVSVRGEARVGSTLTATLTATADGAVAAAPPVASGDEPPAAEGTATAIEPTAIGPAKIEPDETEAVESGPAEFEPSSIDSVVFEWFSEPAPLVRPTPSPVPTATATPVPTQTPTAVPTATPTPAPTSAPVPIPTATATATPAPSVTPTPTTMPSPTPTTPAPTPDVEPPTPQGAEYLVPAADLGLVVRARAIVTRGGEQPSYCLSAPSDVVLAAVQPETPIPPLTPAPTAAPDAAVHAPDIASAAGWSRDDADSDTGDAGAIADPVAEAPAAASEPVVSVNISSDVLLIGGLAAIALIAGAAVFGRNES